jgi:hypothetical protein
MSFINKNAIFTVCNVAYLNKVMVLAESLHKHSNVKIEVFVFDRKRRVEFDSKHCNLHWVEELDIPQFKSLSFKYTVVELTTAFKPWLALSLLEKSAKVIFLDPDVMAFNSLDSIFRSLDEYPVILTPHYFSPKINGLIDDEQIMRFGSYNLGFFAVDSSQKSKNFLNWWSDRCFSNAFDDPQFGIFTDQKWVSIAPIFFPFIHISYNPGLNVAFWNLDERTISTDIDKNYLVNDEYNMLFLHFSAFDEKYPEKLSKRSFRIGGNACEMIAELGLIYSEQLKRYINISDDMDYSFDYMSDGKYISPSLRRAYAANIENFSVNDDPFDSRSQVAEFAKRNSLFQKANTRYTVQGYSSIDSHTIKFKVVYYFMRLVLRIIGANNFMSFSRLLVYLSRYHKNRDMWKY